MTNARTLTDEVAALNGIERHIIDRFIHRQYVARDLSARDTSFSDRVADRVASFGGSWRFITLAIVAITIWMLINSASSRPFDPYPYVLLNLVLSCLAALQAPIIMMSQNRQTTHDRLDAQHDYEVNLKAEVEIMALNTKLDELREQKWVELMKLQDQQLALLAQLSRSEPIPS